MLYNNTTKSLILKKTRVASSFWQKFKGLMLEKNIDFALIFELNRATRAGASIHMLFMRQPIDVLFLDEQKKIVDLVINLKPWTLNFTPKKAAAFIVELPAGLIVEKNLKVGQRLKW